jgi:hypothetical protein
MRKFVGFSVAVLLAASGIFGVATSASASVTVITCDPNGGPGTVAGQTLPQNPGVSVPVLGKVVGPENPCANLNQTLVFVGTADISNGVNFIGTSSGAAGGNFNFTGECVLVNWSSPARSAVLTHGAPVVSGVTSCTFVPGATTGTYTAPGAGRNPILGPVGDAIGANVPVAGPALAIDPAAQASCFNSSGSGSSVFTANGVDTYSSTYSWDGSLNNLRGSISDPSGTSHVFDAKIETAADPAALAGGLYPKTPQAGAYDAFDATDAGCLQKTAALGVNDPSGRTGLNDILIVGTATWDSRTPSLIG